MKKIWIVIVLSILFVMGAVFFIRLFSQRGLDDVSPGIPCDSDLFDKVDILYVIPDFENSSISQNVIWCKNISSMNKSLALHGVYHTFNEFQFLRSDDYLKKGIDDFTECFNIYPERFKPPQMEITRENRELVKKYFKLDFIINEIFHKSYHCGDTGIIKNKIIDII